jgi:hypothetical protein
MTKESKRASWVWIAFREFLYIAGIFILVFLFWFFNREAISEIIKDIQNLKLPQNYYIFIIVAVAFYLMILAFRVIGWRNNAKSLLEYRDVPGVIHIGRFEIKIENDLMLFKKKGFLRSKSWEERKSEFKGVRLSAGYDWIEDEGGRFYYLSYFVQLMHLEKWRKNITLCEKEISSLKQFISIRKTWKETSRALGLPAFEDSPLHSILRGIQDLDKSIRTLAKNNKISFDLKIDSHLPAHTKLLQKDGELTIICDKLKIIISPKLMEIGRIIIPLDEIQHIGPLIRPNEPGKRYTFVVASDSEIFIFREHSRDQGYWLAKLILAGACGRPNIYTIKYESTIE